MAEQKTTPEHTVSAFGDELKTLTDMIVRMGGLAEAQLASALQALARRDSDLATRVVGADAKVDEMEQAVHASVVRLIALRQPVAEDLRSAVSALKIAADIERIGDYAANIAKRVLVLNQLSPVAPIAAMNTMGRLAQELINDVLDAYVEYDTRKAIDVWQRDEEVDELHTSLFRELVTYMMEDPRNITAATHLMFIAKNIERIGDHATNVAETIHFLVEGAALRGQRPKGADQDYSLPPAQAAGEHTE